MPAPQKGPKAYFKVIFALDGAWDQVLPRVLTQVAQWQAKGLQAKERQHAGFLDPDFRPNKDWWGSAAAPGTID